MLLSGCIQAESAAWHGKLPADAETYARVRHIAAYEPPRLQADITPIWPGPPVQVQTSMDMLHQAPLAHAKPTAATMRHRGYGLCHATASQPTPPGIKLGLCYTGGAQF